jgi:hypothetical protein
MGEHQLFDEVALCPNIDITRALGGDSNWEHDLHAICVAIVKFRFDNGSSGIGSGNASMSGSSGRQQHNQHQHLPLQEQYYNDNAVAGAYDFDGGAYLPRQGLSLHPGHTKSRGAVAGHQPASTSKSSNNRNNNNNNVSNDRWRAAAQAARYVAASTPRPENTFYAEDFDGGNNGVNTGVEKGRGWNYTSATAKDAKNVLSRYVGGRTGLPGKGAAAAAAAASASGGNSNPQATPRQALFGASGSGTRGRHWDTALNAAKASAVVKALKLGAAHHNHYRGNSGGTGPQPHISSPKTSSHGGWLSELSSIEKDVAASNRVLASRAAKRDELRAMKGRATEEVLYRMHDNGSNTGTGTGTGTGGHDLPSPPPPPPQHLSSRSGSPVDMGMDGGVSSSILTVPPGGGEFPGDTLLLGASTLADDIRSSHSSTKRVRLKPSVTDCTRGSRGAAVLLGKVGAPASLSLSLRPKSTLRPLPPQAQLSPSSSSSPSSTLQQQRGGGNYNPQYPHPGGNNNPQHQKQSSPGSGNAAGSSNSYVDSPDSNYADDAASNGTGGTGGRNHRESLVRRSQAIKEATQQQQQQRGSNKNNSNSSSNKVPVEVKREQLRRGIRSDGGAVGLFA